MWDCVVVYIFFGLALNSPFSVLLPIGDATATNLHTGIVSIFDAVAGCGIVEGVKSLLCVNWYMQLKLLFHSRLFTCFTGITKCL